MRIGRSAAMTAIAATSTHAGTGHVSSRPPTTTPTAVPAARWKARARSSEAWRRTTITTVSATQYVWCSGSATRIASAIARHAASCAAYDQPAKLASVPTQRFQSWRRVGCFFAAPSGAAAAGPRAPRIDLTASARSAAHSAPARKSSIGAAEPPRAER